MTPKEIDQEIESWKLRDIEEILLLLEENFGGAIESLKTGANYTNVQIRSYAHGIIIMKEILCLLWNGFPDGALARARRIYEQMVILVYMESHKSNADFEKMVSRYYDDQDIRAYFNQMEWYKQIEQSSQQQTCEQKLNEFIGKYNLAGGLDTLRRDIVGKPYWWTGEKKISLTKLSKRLKDPLPHLLFMRANVSTHAGAMGDIALLGRPNDDGSTVYTGATYNGFETSLLLSLYSLQSITAIVFQNLNIKTPSKYKNIQELLKYYDSILKYTHGSMD